MIRGPIERILPLLRCLECGSFLERRDDHLVCRGTPSHAVVLEPGTGLLRFGDLPGTGKYDAAYASRYAGLWAFGYQSLHCGLDEGLYRTVASLVAECLAKRDERDRPPVLVDCGCGVGRAAADAAELAGEGILLGFDASPEMLRLAALIPTGSSPVRLSLDDFGFPAVEVKGRGCSNLFLALGDVHRLPLMEDAVDIVLCVNLVDRLPGGPRPAIQECRRILRPGGRLIFTDPLNWTTSDLWREYADRETILDLFQAHGFTIETWFDDLFYRELVDARRSTEEFKTLVLKARR